MHRLLHARGRGAAVICNPTAVKALLLRFLEVVVLTNDPALDLRISQVDESVHATAVSWSRDGNALDAGVIAACRRELPEIAAYWLLGFKKDKQEGTWSPTLDTIMDTLKQSGASGLDVQSETAVIDKSFAERLREEGFAFHCWTINDADHAKVFQDLGVDSITTDQPALLRRELGLDVK